MVKWFRLSGNQFLGFFARWLPCPRSIMLLSDSGRGAIFSPFSTVCFFSTSIKCVEQSEIVDYAFFSLFNYTDKIGLRG